MRPTNFIDKWIIELADKWNGYGMILFILVTILIAALLSALIGLERYRKGENAGMRTHALLAIGCSFLMTISIWAIRIPDPSLDYDISRIAAATVSGVGFLGAGVIIKDKFTVKGLSTATTLWICAAIGLACGAGFILEAIIVTALTLLAIFVRNRVIIKIDRNAPHVVLTCKAGFPVLETIRETCLHSSLNLKNVDIISIDEKQIKAVAYFPYHSNKLLLDYFAVEMKKMDDVLETEIVVKDNAKHFDQGPHES